jgi:hypothetical protein
MKPKTKKIIGYTVAALLVVIAGVAFYIYKEYNRRVSDTATLKPDFSLAATDLVKEFESNDSLAGRKYMDKVLLVNGSVKKLEKDEAGFFTVILGDSTSTSSVRCSVDSLHTEEMQSLRQWQSIQLKGVCTGFNRDELLGSDVILVRSVLAGNKK